MSASESLPPRARRVIRAGGKLYPDGWANLDASEEDAANAVPQTATEWWIAELDRASTFTRGEEYQSGDFCKDNPSLREVLEQLEYFEKSSDLNETA